MLGDCQRVMETWGISGTIDPFEKIYEVGGQVSQTRSTTDNVYHSFYFKLLYDHFHAMSWQTILPKLHV